MFKLYEIYEVDTRILKCFCIHYSSAETSTKSTPNSQIYIILPREDCVISLSNSCLVVNFEVIRKVDKSRYANGNVIRLVNIGRIALFSTFKLTTRFERHIENISYAHIVPLMYTLMTSNKVCKDLSIGFDRECNINIRRDELTNNKNVKANIIIGLCS